MTTVSILGLGAMGQALAAAFLRKGHDVTVWNRTPGKAAALIEAGAREAASVAEAVAAGDLAIVCVLDYAAADVLVEAAAPALPGRTLVNLTNGTPRQARATADRVAALGASYLDGGIMAIPPMIGDELAFILYSGVRESFDANAQALAALGQPVYLGADAGLASLHDLALLSGMYGLFVGFLHAMALVDSEGIPAGQFVTMLKPWVGAMMEAFGDYAGRIDSGDHARDAMSNLAMQTTAMENILAASREQGIGGDLLAPMLPLMQRRTADGFGADEISGIFELIRRKR